MPSKGCGQPNSDYFCRLPYVKRNDPQYAIWRRRAVPYNEFMTRVVAPILSGKRSLTILDLGAGNCWLSHRLSAGGHVVAAIDLSIDDTDGLGAHRRYGESGRLFTPVRAQFDMLPFSDAAVDVVIFNASIHYATDYTRTLSEALRVMRSTGLLVIMDSPIYHDDAGGRAMVLERERRFHALHGFRSNSMSAEGYLTFDRIEQLARQLGLQVRIMERSPGPLERLRSSGRRLGRRRELATMPLIVARTT